MKTEACRPILSGCDGLVLSRLESSRVESRELEGTLRYMATTRAGAARGARWPTIPENGQRWRPLIESIQERSQERSQSSGLLMIVV